MRPTVSDERSRERCGRRPASPRVPDVPQSGRKSGQPPPTRRRYPLHRTRRAEADAPRLRQHLEQVFAQQQPRRPGLLTDGGDIARSAPARRGRGEPWIAATTNADRQAVCQRSSTNQPRAGKSNQRTAFRACHRQPFCAAATPATLTTPQVQTTLGDEPHETPRHPGPRHFRRLAGIGGTHPSCSSATATPSVASTRC